MVTADQLHMANTDLGKSGPETAGPLATALQ